MSELDKKEVAPEGIAMAGDSVEMDDPIISLGGELKSKYYEFRDARSDIEDDWVEDLRAFMGQYDNDTLAKIREKGDRSQVYVGLTRTKVLAAYSRITDLLFQPGQRFYSIESTPVTKQPTVERELTERAALEIMEAAQVIDPMMVDDLIQARYKELVKELDEETDIRVGKMLEVINDQTLENNLEGSMKDAIMEQVIFGTGAMKAGTLRIERNHKWINSEEGYNLIYEEEPMPEMEAVSIFDLYPDPYATSIDDMRSIFRRHILSRVDFQQLKDSPGFNSDLIEECIHMNPEGNHDEEQHERDRRDIANVNEYAADSGKFEVLEFWGSVNGFELEEHGLEFAETDDLSQE